MGDARRPGGRVGQVGAHRALRPEELLVGGGGEVDRQGVLDVAGAALRASRASRERRTASSSEIGGGSGRLGGVTCSRPALTTDRLGRAQHLAGQQQVGVVADDVAVGVEPGRPGLGDLGVGRAAARGGARRSPTASPLGARRPRRSWARAVAGRGSAPGRPAAARTVGAVGTQPGSGTAGESTDAPWAGLGPAGAPTGIPCVGVRPGGGANPGSGSGAPATTVWGRAATAPGSQAGGDAHPEHRARRRAAPVAA